MANDLREAIRCTVQRKRGGFFVVYTGVNEGFCDYMDFWEGVGWRMFRWFPHRLLMQMEYPVWPEALAANLEPEGTEE